MIMNFTIILQTLNRFKAGLFLNSIIIYLQIIKSNKEIADTAFINPFLAFSNHVRGIEALTHNYTKPISTPLSLQMLKSSKLVFLLMYIIIIVAIVIFLEIRQRKKNRPQETTDQEEGCSIEKILITVNDKRETSMVQEKELMSCEVKEEILKKLMHFEEGTKYTDKNFNLSALSVKLKTNTKYLSYIINRHKKKDFNSYINELRIMYIIKKMENNPAYLNYKISYLADECGFSSHSKFTAVFKNVVGMSPSRFMDMLTKRTK